jgi:hypothetical protein
LEYPGIDGRPVKMGIGEEGKGDMDRIDLAYYRDRWRTLVNAVMNLWVP